MTQTHFTQQIHLQDRLKTTVTQGNGDRPSVCIVRAREVWAAPYSRIKEVAGGLSPSHFALSLSVFRFDFTITLHLLYSFTPAQSAFKSA